MIDNPYAAPASTELARLDDDRRAITFVRAVIGVLITTGIGAVIGAVIGWLMASAAPDFMGELVYPRPRRALDHPATFGAVLGSANGALWGMGAGLVLTLIVAWYRLRIAQLRQRIVTMQAVAEARIA